VRCPPMAKKARLSARARHLPRILRDPDWLTIISALLKDSSKESRLLAGRLLTRSKHGRQVRLLRLILRERPTVEKMAMLLHVSRRTVFRYLSNLGRYGVKLHVKPDFTYRIEGIPKRLQQIV
jgi:hypothetical protein